MAASILYYNTVDDTIAEFTSSDLDVLSDYVLCSLAQTTQFDIEPYGYGTEIGTFVDNYANGVVGDHVPIGNVNQYTTTLYQYQTSTLVEWPIGNVLPDPSDYIGYNVSGSQVTIQEQETTLADLADSIIDRLVTPTGSSYGGPGSWYFGPTAPNDGGTWVSRITYVRYLDASVEEPRYYFWKKLDNGSVTTINDVKRPLKISGSDIAEFSDTDINALVKTVSERIAERNVNFYVVGTAIPSGGTWTEAGVSLLDNYRVIQETSFAQSFETSHTEYPLFSVTYTSAMPDVNPYILNPTFVGDAYYIGLRTDGFNTIYAGGTDYTGTLEQNFVSFVPFTGPATYSGPGSGLYTFFIPIFENAAYVSASGTAGYTAQLNYGGPLTPPASFVYPGGQLAFGSSGYFLGGQQDYTGPGTNYVGPAVTYSGLGNVEFTGTTTFTRAYASIPGSYTADFVGPATYTNQVVFTSPGSTVNYTGGVITSPTVDSGVPMYVYRRVA